MSLKICITGTDTGVGKTYITAGLLTSFKNRNLSTIALKPVASDSKRIEGKLINDDATLLKNNASIQLPDFLVNPFVYELPIAPNIAADMQNEMLTVSALLEKTKAAFHHPADVYLIEGFGGWYAPLNPQETMADFVKAAQLNVLLVVGMRLGCLNHTLLTVKAIQHSKLNFMGWIANCIDPDMLYCDKSIDFLKNSLSIPYLGKVGYGEDPAISMSLSSRAVFSAG